MMCNVAFLLQEQMAEKVKAMQQDMAKQDSTYITTRAHHCI